MKTLLAVEFPGLPPTANHIYRTGKSPYGCGSNYRYKTAETREWQERIICIMSEARKFETFFGKVVSHITLKTKDKRRWDLDNRIKALHDCLAPAGIIADDSQIWLINIRRQVADEATTKIILKGIE